MICSDLQNLAIPKDHDGICLYVVTAATGFAPIDGRPVNLTFGGINVYNNSTFQPLRAGNSGIDRLRNIATGGLISSVSTDLATGMGVSFDHLGTTFTAGSKSTIGFSVNKGGTNDGWMRVVFTGTPIIKDWAYDTSGSITNTTSIALASGAILEVSAAAGHWTVGAKQTLAAGSGVTGDTTIAAALASAGDSGVGSRAIAGNLSDANGSIFEWNLNASSTSAGFDITTGDAFWNTFGGSQTWSMLGVFGNALNWNAPAAGNGIQSGSTSALASTGQSFTPDSAITGLNSVINIGANTATLSATNAHTGNTTVSAGTVALSSTGIVTTTLSATNTYTGDTTVSADTLALSSSGSINNSTSIAVASGAILDVSAVSGNSTVGAERTLTGDTTIAATLASAGVIYSNLQNLAIPKDNDGIYLNVLTGATGFAPFNGWHVNLTFGGINVYNDSTFQPLRVGNTGIDSLRNIATGGLISSVSTNFATDMGVSFDHLGTTFTAGSEGYIGFSVNNGVTNYGWMRVVFTGTGTPVIKDWAYDTSGGSLAAGNVIQSGSTYTLDSTSQSFTLDSAITGANSVIKISANTTTLSATNTHTGNTTVSAGTLALSSSGSVANSTSIAVASGAILDVSAVSGNWTVGAGQTLTGGGGVTGNTTIAGTHNAGNSGVGSQAIAGNLNYANGSIFEWDLNTSSTSSGFDSVSATGSIDVGTAGTVFKVIFGATALANITDPGNAFWSTTQTWSMAAIFGKAFTSGAFQSVATNQDVSSYGSFTISSSSLTWSAVPESSTALAGILLGAGLLCRRR